jgi:hypothetical protein
VKSGAFVVYGGSLHRVAGRLLVSSFGMVHDVIQIFSGLVEANADVFFTGSKEWPRH